MDGTALDDFLSTWAMAVRQGTDFTAPSPFLDRGILTAVDPTTPVFDHGSIEFKGPSDALVPTCNRKTIKLSFTSEFMAELKARVGAPCTTFQCMLTHMWKKTTQARGVKPEEFTQVRVAGGRQLPGQGRTSRAVRLVRQHGAVPGTSCAPAMAVWSAPSATLSKVSTETTSAPFSTSAPWRTQRGRSSWPQRQLPAPCAVRT
ncbi:hypothetical protein ACQ4PT_007292 [Festuca glaucescens]